jgi:hypothetical protein
MTVITMVAEIAMGTDDMMVVGSTEIVLLIALV